MKKRRVDDKSFNDKINKTGMGFIFKDLGEERYLEVISKYRQFDDKDERLKNIASEIVNNYFRDEITHNEFMKLVYSMHPEYRDNYTFYVYLEQCYRRQYIKRLKEIEKEKQNLRKLALVYKKRHM